MTPKEREYSLLAEAAPPRDLAIALAHCLVAAKLGTPRMALLSKLVSALPWPEQQLCKIELTLCRAAKRGELRAEAV